MSVRDFRSAIFQLNTRLASWGVQPSEFDFAQFRARRARRRLRAVADQLSDLPVKIVTSVTPSLTVAMRDLSGVVETARSAFDVRSALIRTEILIDTIETRLPVELVPMPVSFAELDEDADAEGRAPLSPPPRYANATLLDATSTRLDETRSLTRGELVLLQIDIGALSSASHVRNPNPLPELPDGARIDVVISSNDFLVSDGEGPGGGETGVATDHLELTKNGAINAEKRKALRFSLIAPMEEGKARCRINYYFHDALIQSHRLTASIGIEGGFRIESDFDALPSFRGLAAVPDRPRVSLLTNYSGENRHEFVLRPASGGSGTDPVVFVPQQVDDVIDALRDGLRARAPTSRVRTAQQLEMDLRTLAPLGWELYSTMLYAHAAVFDPARKKPDEQIIQIVRTRGSHFTAPWGLLYDIQLQNGVDPETCPLVRDAAQLKAVAESGARSCPHCAGKRDVLCPFGFWGFRYSIEQIESSDAVTTSIAPPPNCDILIAKTTKVASKKALDTHLANLENRFVAKFPGARVSTVSTRAAFEEVLERDLPFIYFYCHGARDTTTSRRSVVLAIGASDLVTSTDIFGWIDHWRRTKAKKVWDAVRPIVFINACHSVEVKATSLLTYLDAFITTGGAAAVIGTEVIVHQDLAREFADNFFDRVLSGATVDAAMRQSRLDFLADRNLFGLVYTPYCWADLRVA